MKKLLCFLLAVVMVLPLVSCNMNDTGPTSGLSDTLTEEDTKPALVETLELFVDGVSEYTIVRADMPKDYEIDAAVEFNNRIAALTGKTMKITTDWGDKNKTEKEVLIGKTNREGVDYTLDGVTLERGGFFVGVKGERLVITANDARGLNTALDWFFDHINPNGATELKSISVSRELMHTVVKTESAELLEGTKMNYTNVKAMWLSQFDLSDVYGVASQRSEADFRKLMTTILENVSGIGINTVIVQVRPNADSMYPSEFYAPSTYVVGDYGKDFTYDPFEIIVEIAHECELSVHAWINPMRAMTTAEIEKLNSKYPLKKWWDDSTLRAKYLPVVSSRVYLNVGEPEVRKLIVDGARELMEKYDVDGLHMDDYFYPTQEKSFDSASFAALGGGASLGDWRRENINSLVADLYAAAKAVNPDILFGISPAGTMEKDYEQLYADIYTWCGKAGYIDYICPQIYFGLEHGSQAFGMNTEKWNGIIKAEGVKMWIGMTLGKALNGSKGTEDQYGGTEAGKTEWIRNQDVLKRCLEKSLTADNCTGVAYFCYQYFWDPVSGKAVDGTKAERDNFLPLLQTIEWN